MVAETPAETAAAGSGDTAPGDALPTTSAGWRRRVWAISWPIVLSNLSVPMVGLVDTAVMGHLPDPVFIGAVALGAMVFNFLYWGFGFLRMGTTGFVAQMRGARDTDGLRAVLARAFVLALGIGLLVLLAQYPLVRATLWLLDASDRVERLAGDYIFIRIWSAPATLAGYVVLGYLIGMQQTRSALLIQLTLNIGNVLLALLFVMHFGWGVKGVAAATLIAETGGAVLGVVVLLRSLRRVGGRLRPGWLHDSAPMLRMLRANTDIFIRTVCLIGAFFWFTAAGARLGDLTLAVNAVLLHFQHMMAYGLDGFAFAAEALAGSACGARNRRALRAAVVASTQMALVVALGFALVYLLAGRHIIDLLSSIPEVREVAYDYLPWLMLMPLISVWSFQLDGIYIGATRTAEMRNGMLVSLLVYAGVASLAIPSLGNHGLWLAFALWMLARAATLAAWYPRLERALPADATRA